jgi:flagellar hook-length control protein FliK
MTALAFGTVLINGDPAAAGAQSLLPHLPQLPVPQLADLPVPLLAKPLQFGEQLRQSLDVASPDAAAMPPLPVVTPGQGQVVNESLTEQPETPPEGPADDATPSFSTPFTASQPVAAPLEYAQRSTDATQPQVAVAPAVVTVTQWTTPDAAARDNAVLSALQATTPATMPLGAKDAPGVNSGDRQRNSAMTQLASLTNGGAVQAMVEGMTRQPGMLAPAAAAPAQTVNLQRSPLEVALGERLQLHITQRSEHAVIRLDPPSMGTIEIVIQREAGSIQVHLRASNAEVARQLHGIGDALRQDLIHRQHGDVSVHVSDGSREQGAGQHGHRQQHAQREAPGRALSESNEDSPKSFTLAVDEERAA